MKKFWFLLVATLLILTGCGSGGEETGTDQKGEGSTKTEETTETDAITVWAWDPAFNIAALEVAENYSDFELNIVENAQDDIVQKLNTGLSTGTLKGMPNIVLIEDYRAQSFLQAYPDAFFDLSDYINPDDFANYKIGPTSFDGKQYGVPFDTGVTGLYLRTDYLEEAGYTLEDFQNITWDEYLVLSKDIVEKIGKPMFSNDPNDLGIIRVMIQTAGSWYVKEDGKTPYIADNEALKEAFRLYKDFVDSGIVQEHTDWSQFVGNLNGDVVISTATGNWITPSIKQEESHAGKWGVAPIPRLNLDGAVNASNLGGSSWYVLNIDGKENAAQFLADTFGSNVDFYQDLVREVGALGTYLPATKGEAYKEADEFFGGQLIIQDFSTWMDHVPNVNYGMHTYAIEDILVVAMQNYLSGADLDQVLQDAQAQAESQLR